MSTTTPSREEITAHKHKLAAERATTIAALPADRGPAVLPTDGPFAPRPAIKPVAEPSKPRGVPTVEAGLSADCLAADAKYNDAVAAWYADAERYEAAVAHRFDSLETVTIADLAKRRDAVNGSELTLAQTAVLLQREYGTRTAARAAELKLYTEGCEENLAAVKESVTRKLNEIGISIESQPSYSVNPTAAENVFAARVRESSDWLAAFQKLGSAQASHQAEVEAFTASRTQLANAEGYLATVVRRLAG